MEQNPDSAATYVMLAWDPTLGVGVDQSLGFIELPAGADESTAGRPLGGTAEGTTVDLGDLSQSGDAYLPDGD